MREQKESVSYDGWVIVPLKFTVQQCIIPYEVCLLDHWGSFRRLPRCDTTPKVLL